VRIFCDGETSIDSAELIAAGLAESRARRVASAVRSIMLATSVSFALVLEEIRKAA